MKDEFGSIIQGERKIIMHKFSFYQNGRKITGDMNLAFLKQLYDHRTENYCDWVFATNVTDTDLGNIIR